MTPPLASRAAPGAERSARSRTSGAALMALGAGGLALSTWGLWQDIGWIAQPFYAYAWWSYIFILDGFTAWRRGSSLITGRRRRLLPIILWSTTFWFFFELLNIRYQNWYYVGAFYPRSLVEGLLSGAFVVACFSTVFTGLFETYEALGSCGLFQSWRARPRQLPVWASYAVQGLGAAMVILSLAAPRYLAPLVWGSLTFILDPWNYRRGARSVLKDLERGDVHVLARLFAAGLLCGLVWECFNYFAPQKWIYTVRGLEELKLFEMPLAGFLGFPALAFDAFAAYSTAAYLFHGNDTWEHPSDLPYPLAPRPRLPRLALLASLPMHVAFWGVVNVLMIPVNLGSVELRLDDLPSLSAGGRRTLAAAGIDRPLQLLRRAEDGARREDLRLLLGLTAVDLERLLEEAALFTFKGIGRRHGDLLRRAGVTRISDLGRREPEALHAEILQHCAPGALPAPRLEMVRVWVLAARQGP